MKKQVIVMVLLNCASIGVLVWVVSTPNHPLWATIVAALFAVVSLILSLTQYFSSRRRPSLGPTSPSVPRRSFLAILAGLVAVDIVITSLLLFPKFSSSSSKRSIASSPTPPPPPLGKLLLVYRGHKQEGPLWSVRWSPDSTRIASASQTEDDSLQVWHANDGSLIHEYTGHNVPVLAVTWSPDGKRIASASDDGKVHIWDVASGHHLSTYSVIVNSIASQVSAVAWSPNGKFIVAGGYSSQVQVWNAMSGEMVAAYSGHANFVTAVAWSPDSKYVASASLDGTVQVWKAMNGEKVYTYTGHIGVTTINGFPSTISDVYAVAWSPNGNRIASGGLDKTVQVWDAMTGKNVLIYRGHTSSVNAVAWSPDNQRIASGSKDWTVQVWDAGTGKNPYTYRGHSYFVTAVDWSPDGTRIASGSFDFTVQVYGAGK